MSDVELSVVVMEPSAPNTGISVLHEGVTLKTLKLATTTKRTQNALTAVITTGVKQSVIKDSAESEQYMGQGKVVLNFTTEY